MSTLDSETIKVEDDSLELVKPDLQVSLKQFAWQSQATRRSPRIAASAGLSLKLKSTPDSQPQLTGKHRSKPASKKAKRGYAAPEMYSHLELLSDHLKEGLDVIFSGINPGFMSAQKGHHFANPTNHFWRCLHGSGLTLRRLPPSEDHTLPDEFNLGLTNLVSRPSAEAAELSKVEMKAAVPVLLTKIAQYRPRFLCFVGMGIWEIVKSALVAMSLDASDEATGGTKKKKADKSSVGLQPFKLSYGNGQAETFIYVVPSTSGRVVQYQLTDKVKIFSDLKRLVDKVDPSAIDSSKMVTIRVPSQPLSRRSAQVGFVPLCG